MASSDVPASSWETFEQASKAASSNEIAAVPDPMIDAPTKAKVKAADSSYRIAAATNALVTDADWKGETFGVEHVLPTFDESSDEEQRGMSKAFVASCSRQTQEGIAKLRRDLLQWTTMGAKLVSNKFGQRAMEDAFMNQIVFDDENKCYAVTEVDGMEVFSDITQGMRMAQKSGMTERDGLEVLLSKCGNCTKELTVGGDKVILYSRSGPGGEGRLLVQGVLQDRV